MMTMNWASAMSPRAHHRLEPCDISTTPYAPGGYG